MIILFVLNCWNNADRDNPLDPKSPLFKNSSAISGNVSSYYAPHKPVVHAEIIVKPIDLTGFTDQNGNYHLDGIPSGAYTIIAKKSGYGADSAQIDLSPSAEQVLSFNLDALPSISDATIHSIHISRWFPQPYDQFYLEVQAKIDDADGFNDIDSVFLVDENFRIQDTLVFQPQSGIYQIIKDLTNSAANIGDVVGQPSYIEAFDKAGNFSISNMVIVNRVIMETPLIISPTSLQNVNATPTLIWQDINLHFSYFYEVKIYRTDLPSPTLVWTGSQIPTTTTAAVADSLSPGKYYWTVAAIDNFGDWSRSKEGSFQIQ